MLRACETADDHSQEGILDLVGCLQAAGPNMLGETPNSPYRDPAWLGNHLAETRNKTRQAGVLFGVAARHQPRPARRLPMGCGRAKKPPIARGV